MTKLIFLLFAVFTLFSCETRTSENAPEIVAEPTINGSSNITATGDTLIVSGKSVIFFSITKDEYTAIEKQDGEDSGINEVLDDFYFYASEVGDSIKQVGFHSRIVANKIFEFRKNDGSKSFIYCHPKEGSVGVILFDGLKEPLLSYGVGTDIDYFTMIDGYFYNFNPFEE